MAPVDCLLRSLFNAIQSPDWLLTQNRNLLDQEIVTVKGNKRRHGPVRKFKFVERNTAALNCGLAATQRNEAVVVEISSLKKKLVSR